MFYTHMGRYIINDITESRPTPY